MHILARASLVAGLIAIGCSSSTTSGTPASTNNHLLMENRTTIPLSFVIGLSTDDTASWATWTNQLTQQTTDIVASTTVPAGHTQPWPTPARGHYRWGYRLTTGANTPIYDTTFDVLDAVTDIHLTATSTGSGDTDGGPISNPDGGSGNPTGGCIPSGGACTDSNDNCCTVCGLNQAGICT